MDERRALESLDNDVEVDALFDSENKTCWVVADVLNVVLSLIQDKSWSVVVNNQL